MIESANDLLHAARIEIKRQDQQIVALQATLKSANDKLRDARESRDKWRQKAIGRGENGRPRANRGGLSEF